MKKFLMIFVFILIFNNYTSFSNTFDLTPVNFNFYTLEARDNVIIACGDFGSMFISVDNAVNWRQEKVFDQGKIVKVSISPDYLTAFNDVGEIKRSLDSGKTWEHIRNIKDSVFTVIEYPDGYFIRAYNSLLTLDEELSTTNYFQLNNRPGYTLRRGYELTSAFYNNNFIVQIDSIVIDSLSPSGLILRLDSDLNIIDTISFAKLGLCDNCYGRYRLGSDSEYFYYEMDKNIFRTDDFINWEKIFDLTSHYVKYKVFDGMLYFEELGLFDLISLYLSVNKINYPNAEENIVEFLDTLQSHHRKVNDFLIHNNKVIFAGNNKLIIVLDKNSSEQLYYSDFNVSSAYTIPDRIDDSTFLFICKGASSCFYPYIYLSTNNCLTFRPMTDPSNTKLLKFNSFIFNYYNKEDNQLYLIGTHDAMPLDTPGAFISNDTGKTFIKKDITISDNNQPKSDRMPNIQRDNDNFIFTLNTKGNKDYTKTKTFNKDFELVSELFDSNQVINYQYSVDTNTFIMECLNTLKSSYEIKYTSDKGNSWKYIKKYDKLDSILFYKEIAFNDETYLAIVSIREVDSIANIDILDINERSIQTVYTSKVYFEKNQYGILNGIDQFAICSDRDTVYLAVNDTIFYSDNILEPTKWQIGLLPDNGRIYETFCKFDDKFYTRYKDDKNGFNIFWIQLADNQNDVKENEIQPTTYLYFYPPYPVPANSGEIRAHIYWDPAFDIDKAEITISNELGSKIGGKEQVIIEKETYYSGYLIWNCSNVPSGVYFVNLKHGSASRTLKVIVN